MCLLRWRYFGIKVEKNKVIIYQSVIVFPCAWCYPALPGMGNVIVLYTAEIVRIILEVVPCACNFWGQFFLLNLDSDLAKEEKFLLRSTLTNFFSINFILHVCRVDFMGSILPGWSRATKNTIHFSNLLITIHERSTRKKVWYYAFSPKQIPQNIGYKP